MARPQGSFSPRERMLRDLERKYPKFSPVPRLVEQAEKVRLEIAAQERQHKADLKAGAAEPTPPVSRADRALLHKLYVDTARFLVPQLRAQDITLGGAGGGPVTVTFQRDPDEKV